jgi:hypothetical protein
MEARPKDIDGCPGGETLAEVSARADRAIARIRALEGDVLVFAHRDIFPLLAARWIALPALEARRLYLETAPLRIPGYDRIRLACRHCRHRPRAGILPGGGRARIRLQGVLQSDLPYCPYIVGGLRRAGFGGGWVSWFG